MLRGGASSRADVLGVLLALLAGLSYAAYTVLAKQHLEEGHAPPAVMAAAFGLGGLLSLPVLSTQPLSWLIEGEGVVLALYLGLATTTLAHLLFVRGLAVLPAASSSTNGSPLLMGSVPAWSLSG